MKKANRNGVIASVTGGVTALALIGACGAGGPNQNSDLQNQPIRYPDFYRLVMDVDGHPTIGMTCIDGQGFATTSRDQSAAAAMPIPAWNSFCLTQVGSRFSVTGNASDEPEYHP